MGEAGTAYEALLRALEEQRKSKTLVTLPQSLTSLLRSRASQLRQSIRTAADRRSLAYRLKEAELGALQRMVSELLGERLRILIRAAQTGADPGEALPFEQSLYSELRSLLEDYAELVEECSRTLDLSRDFARRETVTVAFLEDAPALVDASGRKRGPFRRGSVASLPRELVGPVVSSGKARRIGPL
ncbi:MAG: hypothetical protein NZ953_01890 [Thaumarchaeota archaeon]|nr:hypothetical protein [Candidatus Calditenuaceae archaeon]MCX8203158.1 hypothetical protein [Nitrososphaeria archaeon]